MAWCSSVLADSGMSSRPVYTKTRAGLQKKKLARRREGAEKVLEGMEREKVHTEPTERHRHRGRGLATKNAKNHKEEKGIWGGMARMEGFSDCQTAKLPNHQTPKRGNKLARSHEGAESWRKHERQKRRIPGTNGKSSENMKFP